MTKSKMVPRLLLAVGLGIGIVLAILLVRERFTMVEIEHWVGRLRGWAPAIYLTLWLVVPVLCLPGTPRGLAAGALFGLVRGSLYGRRCNGRRVGKPTMLLMSHHTRHRHGPSVAL